MSTAQAVSYQDELAAARATAAARRKELAEAPEMSVDDILAGFKRELDSVSVPGFGKVYFYPLSIAEYVDLQEQISEDGTTTARNMVRTIIALARNSDGSLKFKREHEATLLEASFSSVGKLAGALVQSVRFTLASAEKK